MSKRHWSKHPLEGDGTVTQLFQYLWKKNKDLESCPLVRIPDTIVYEHNFPNGWYSHTNGELRRRSGKDIETKAIIQEFERKAKREGEEHDIVAYYLSCAEDENGEHVNQVEYFNLEELEDFFFKRKTREKGILQRFVTPKGPQNFIIQAIWSPHVMMLERRVNINRLSDIKSFTSYERAVTYEGPSHFSNEVFCAPHLQKEIKKVCTAIVKHFASTEHKKITRMVLYFKIGADNRLYLLWSSSIRIAPNGQQQDKLELPKAVPLNLSPKFNLSSTLQSDPTADTLSLLPSTMTDTALSLSGTFGHKNESLRRLQKLKNSGSSQSQKRTSDTKSTLSRKSSQDQVKENTVDPNTIILNEEDAAVLEQAAESLENVIYEAYSHFLEGSISPFEFELENFGEAFQTKLSEVLETNLIEKLECIKEDHEGKIVFIFNRPCASISKLQHEIQEFKKSLLDDCKIYLSESRELYDENYDNQEISESIENSEL